MRDHAIKASAIKKYVKKSKKETKKKEKENTKLKDGNKTCGIEINEKMVKLKS